VVEPGKTADTVDRSIGQRQRFKRRDVDGVGSVEAARKSPRRLDANDSSGIRYQRAQAVGEIAAAGGRIADPMVRLDGHGLDQNAPFGVARKRVDQRRPVIVVAASLERVDISIHTHRLLLYSRLARRK
jgi:DNA-binding transcriptional regulator LsrR (DeoR family)